MTLTSDCPSCQKVYFEKPVAASTAANEKPVASVQSLRSANSYEQERHHDHEKLCYQTLEGHRRKSFHQPGYRDPLQPVQVLFLPEFQASAVFGLSVQLLDRPYRQTYRIRDLSLCRNRTGPAYLDLANRSCRAALDLRVDWLVRLFLDHVGQESRDCIGVNEGLLRKKVLSALRSDPGQVSMNQPARCLHRNLKHSLNHTRHRRKTGSRSSCSNHRHKGHTNRSWLHILVPNSRSNHKMVN